jgi:hypothetical protein
MLHLFIWAVVGIGVKFPLTIFSKNVVSTLPELVARQAIGGRFRDIWFGGGM